MAGVFLLLSLLLLLFLLLFCVYVAVVRQGGFLAWMYDWLFYKHASSYLWRPEQDIRSIRTEVRSDCGATMWVWKLNSGGLEGQPVVSTSEPSLWPLYLISETGSLIETGESVSSRDLPISASRCWDCRHMPGFYMSGRDPDQVLWLEMQALCWLRLSSPCGSLVANPAHQS